MTANDLGETLSEAQIVEWFRKNPDYIQCERNIASQVVNFTNGHDGIAMPYTAIAQLLERGVLKLVVNQ